MAKKSPLEGGNKDDKNKTPKEAAKEKKVANGKPEEVAAPQAPRPTEAMGIAIDEDNRDKFGKMIGEYDPAKDGKLPVEVALAMVVEGGGHPGKVFANIEKFDLQPGDAGKLVEHYKKTGNLSYILDAIKNKKFSDADCSQAREVLIQSGKFNFRELTDSVESWGKSDFINKLLTEDNKSIGTFAVAKEVLGNLSDGGLNDGVAKKLLDSYIKMDPGADFKNFISLVQPIKNKFSNPQIFDKLVEQYP